jgi:hypothetical protein
MSQLIVGKLDLDISAEDVTSQSQEALPSYELDPAVRKRVGEVIAKAVLAANSETVVRVGPEQPPALASRQWRHRFIDVLANDIVAFARRFFEAAAIQNFNLAACVLNQSSLLKRVCA